MAGHCVSTDDSILNENTTNDNWKLSSPKRHIKKATSNAQAISKAKTSRSQELLAPTGPLAHHKMLSAFTARPIVELKQRDKSKIESILAYGTSAAEATGQEIKLKSFR